MKGIQTGCHSKIPKPRKALNSDWKLRYQQAHYNDSLDKYPNFHKDGHYTPPVYPNVKTANGLTNAICNYVNWMGGVGNRINVMGRLVEGSEKTQSGAIISKKKFIKSSTLKGTSDIIATLPNGKTWHIEIKVKNDRPRPEQIKMQERIRNTGGHYDFIGTMEQFYYMYDCIISPELFL